MLVDPHREGTRQRRREGRGEEVTVEGEPANIILNLRLGLRRRSFSKMCNCIRGEIHHADIICLSTCEVCVLKIPTVSTDRNSAVVPDVDKWLIVCALQILVKKGYNA